MCALSESVDQARGDWVALAAIVEEHQHADTAEARAAMFRARRFLKELEPTAKSGPAPQRTMSQALAASIVADLESDDGFLIDGEAIPSLLEYARSVGAERATEILTTLARVRAFSARSLLLKVADAAAFDSLGVATKEWLWAFALSPTGQDARERLDQWRAIFPRRLVPLLETAKKGDHVGALVYGGYVYLLREDGTNPCILKVGMTSKSVSERLVELNSSTSQHRRLLLLMEWPVAYPRDAERQAHEALAKYRVRDGREFFQLDAQLAIRIIDAVLA